MAGGGAGGCGVCLLSLQSHCDALEIESCIAMCDWLSWQEPHFF